ncbi:hypothetical protein ON010_g18693 [Phytophthora cinnamomi]|nr:hypothetical protein ON010_g18693 [Phytophthora cinnamomi]
MISVQQQRDLVERTMVAVYLKLDNAEQRIREARSELATKYHDGPVDPEDLETGFDGAVQRERDAATKQAAAFLTQPYEMNQAELDRRWQKGLAADEAEHRSADADRAARQGSDP